MSGGQHWEGKAQAKGPGFKHNRLRPGEEKEVKSSLKLYGDKTPGTSRKRREKPTPRAAGYGVYGEKKNNIKKGRYPPHQGG